MLRSVRLFLALVALLVSAARASTERGAPITVTPSTPEEIVQQLPVGDWWLSHAVGDLMPFWIHPDALGAPLGAFPSTRCDDGTKIDYAKPCPEIARNGWLMYDRQRYLVALSRQVYGYGVLFHLTGDPQFLTYMKAGVDYIRANVIDREGGGMRLTQNAETGEWGPARELRDTQQLAYGLLGMSFYYYLTRDPEVLPDILAAKDYIYQNYWNGPGGYLQWTLADNGDQPATLRQLTAQLDQMNAYLVMLAPILPEPYGEDFKFILKNLSQVMIGQFYSPTENVFFLSVNKPEDLDLNKTGTTDFGHTIKAMWMIRNTGLLTGDQDLVKFAEDNGRRVLERAYLENSGSWASAPLAGGRTDVNKSWWIYAELDQFAGSLAMTDIMAAKYLPRTHDYWFRYFVDRQYGEVWTGVDGITNLPQRDSPKAWPWKNAYHSFEHAMVGYITSQQIHGQPVTLYYAFQNFDENTVVRPYYFTANVDAMESWQDDRAGTIYKVTFSGIH